VTPGPASAAGPSPAPPHPNIRSVRITGAAAPLGDDPARREAERLRGGRPPRKGRRLRGTGPRGSMAGTGCPSRSARKVAVPAPGRGLPRRSPVQGGIQQPERRCWYGRYFLSEDGQALRVRPAAGMGGRHPQADKETVAGMMDKPGPAPPPATIPEAGYLGLASRPSTVMNRTRLPRKDPAQRMICAFAPSYSKRSAP
jgi:hypothetical protein